MAVKIIHTISSYDVFGPEKTTINECLALKERGHDALLIVIWPKGNTPFLEKVKREGIPYYHLGSDTKLDLSAILKLKKILRDQKADLVHSHGYKSDMISLIACRMAKIPVVTTVHGWTSENRKVRVYEKVQAFSWRFFDRVICVSGHYKRIALKTGVPDKNIVVIHNGIIAENNRLDNAAKKREMFIKKHDIPGDHINVGIIGRLSVEKGHKYFLEAASCVLKETSDVSFIIAGDGPKNDEIRKNIEDFGISKNVHMVGHIDDMKSLYSAVDIMVMTSLREGLPNVLLESMLYEKPVVATKVGGIPEAVSNGSSGLLVSPEDGRAVAEAILKLIREPELKRTFTSSAKKKLLDDFTFENRMKRIEKLYSEETGKVL